MRKSIALLSNVSFVNKGDALMAECIQRRIEKGYRIAYPFNASVHSRRHLFEYLTHMHPDVPNWSLKRTVINAVSNGADLAAGLLPRDIRNRFGVVVDEDIDVVFDVSGYCFGDHWGAERMIRATEGYKKWYTAGKPVILMPKTWGPFETIPSALINALFAYVTIAFARDMKSYESLKAILDEDLLYKLAFAPDYTNDLEPASTQRTGPYYIIPSYRMIDSKTVDREGYLAFISEVRESLVQEGRGVSLLIHETSNDLWFRENADRMGFTREEVDVPQSAQEAKTLIASSQGVVTSRLHGLYNSLNTITPVLVAAWSFKYEQALIQYGCHECLLNAKDLVGSFQSKKRFLTDPESRNALETTLIKAKHEQKDMTAAMWSQILDYLPRSMN